MSESTLTNVKNIIAISSCKGGVGKSTVAACLALELAKRGLKVGLVDTDIYGPSVPTLFNLVGQQIYTNEQKQILPVEFNGLKVMSFGFLLGDAPAVMRGPIVSQYMQQLLHQTAWGELDYLLIDMPPGTGDVQLTITQTVQLNGAIIVTTPQSLSLVDVQRGILMFEKVNVPMLGIVENMSYFECDDCQKKHHIFGTNETSPLEERFGLTMLGEWPLVPELAERIAGPLEYSYIKETADKAIDALSHVEQDRKKIPIIKSTADEIILKWQEGRTLKVRNHDLRLNCQCALCVDERTGKKLLNEKDVKPDIAAKEISLLGNYALGITWNDGHSSGIYPYKDIERLAITT